MSYFGLLSAFGSKRCAFPFRLSNKAWCRASNSTWKLAREVLTSACFYSRLVSLLAAMVSMRCVVAAVSSYLLAGTFHHEEINEPTYQLSYPPRREIWEKRNEKVISLSRPRRPPSLDEHPQPAIQTRPSLFTNPYPSASRGAIGRALFTPGLAPFVEPMVDRLEMRRVSDCIGPPGPAIACYLHGALRRFMTL
jgi:hypothetical protein